MLQATMHMRERAMALHLHFPLKFTLSRGTGPAVDARAAWAAIIKRVEAVRQQLRSLHACSGVMLSF
jgi:hypothetical protein